MEVDGDGSEEVKAQLLIFRGFFKTLISLLIAVVALRLFVLQPFFVDGSSMESTFSHKDLVFAEKISYKISDPKRQEVILLYSPLYPEETLIKRIVGLPGERIEIRDGSVFVFNREFPSGFRLEELYRTDQFSETIEPAELSKDEFFVVGDNNAASQDSREFGPTKRETVIGRVFIRLFPLEKIGIF